MWSAQWGLRDDAVDTEGSNEDVRQLIDDIIEDARRRADRYDLSIEWELSGDAPGGEPLKTCSANSASPCPRRSLLNQIRRETSGKRCSGCAFLTCQA